MKASWTEGEDSIWGFHQHFHKSASPAFQRLCLQPLGLQRQTMEYLCCSACLIPAPYASTKKSPSTLTCRPRAGINNTRCTPLCFKFTKKIGVSKNQHHMGFCVCFFKVCCSFLSNKWKWFLILCHKLSKCAALWAVCVPALRGALHWLGRTVGDYAGLTSGRSVCGDDSFLSRFYSLWLELNS